MKDWRGRRVVILGAARQGIALARYLASHGAEVVLNDQRLLHELADARRSLADLQIEWVCGGHPKEILDGADLVCPSGGVPLTLPIVLEARWRGIPLSNDSQLFLEPAPCRVIGITGSAGKTTTTALVGRIARAALEDAGNVGVYSHAWVGGNIGDPLIAYLDDIRPNDLAVIELSSFQLELMTLSPQLATILNVTPNHLDRHKTFEAYVAIKARILKFQSPDDLAVLGVDDPGAWSLAKEVRGRLITFGFGEPPRGLSGVYLRGDGIVLRDAGRDIQVLSLREVALRGEHNLRNIMAACAIAFAAGLPPEAFTSGVSGFMGIPHRLEFVRTWRGADWYNDSIATAPERVIAAIKSFDRPLIVLAGGRDKDLPWEALSHLVRLRVDHLILFGEAAEKIARSIETAPCPEGENGGRPHSISRCMTLHEAVLAAAEVVAPGDVVLLSPGGTSFDEFRDFEDRGEAFKRWVMELP